MPPSRTDVLKRFPSCPVLWRTQYAAFVLHGIHTLEICTELLLDAFPHSLLTVDRVVVFALVVVVVGCLLLSLFYCSTTNQPPPPWVTPPGRPVTNKEWRKTILASSGRVCYNLYNCWKCYKTPCNLHLSQLTRPIPSNILFVASFPPQKFAQNHKVWVITKTKRGDILSQ